MPLYSVSVQLGRLFAEEVEADNEDAAISKAIEEWASDALEILNEGTFDVHEVAAA